MKERMIRVLDKDGKVLAVQKAKSNAQRWSVRGAADQRQLDSMYVKGATKGFIGEVPFEFVNGISQCILEL